MSRIKEWIELKNTIRHFAIWALTSLIDSSFLALWVAIQWLINNKVVVPLRLTGLDNLVLSIFQILFAISTLSPVAITIYRDIRIMLLRTQKRIRKEIEIGEIHESD
jgi:hypothetical protein